MNSQPCYLLDQSSNKVAQLDVEQNGNSFRGSICLEATPPELKRLFEEFEEYVEGQMFNLADDIEDRISDIPLQVVFPNNMEEFVEDLQVYPSTKRVSFKLRQAIAIA